jgi:hypothetical protein
MRKGELMGEIIAVSIGFFIVGFLAGYFFGMEGTG